MKGKYSLISICLLCLLGLRLLSHLQPALASQSFGSIVAFVIYLITLIGVIKRRRWGAMTSGIMGIMDLLMTLVYIGGVNMIGAVVFDGLIVFLSYHDYRHLKRIKYE